MIYSTRQIEAGNQRNRAKRMKAKICCRMAAHPNYFHNAIITLRNKKQESAHSPSYSNNNRRKVRTLNQRSVEISTISAGNTLPRTGKPACL